jgi:hypothetical protein
MIAIPSPEHKPGQPGPGNNRYPKRCIDLRCPSRSRCRRPGFIGQPCDFSLNRAGAAFCGYFMTKEGVDRG